MADVRTDVAELRALQRTQADDLATTIVERLKDVGLGEGENRRLTMRDFWIAAGALGVGIAIGYGDKIVHALQGAGP